MKNVKIKGYWLAVIVILAVMPIVVSAVEYKNSYKPVGISNQRSASVQVVAPTTVFQSTSTLTGSGSALSATPMLNADGTVSAPARIPGGPRRIDANGNGVDDDEEGLDPPDDKEEDENPNPLGDAVLPLLLMSLTFCGYLYLRRKRSAA